MLTKYRTAAIATPDAEQPAASASTRLSHTRYRTSRHRVAPTAMRTANSSLSGEQRASRRLDTFAQAMRSRTPTRRRGGAAQNGYHQTSIVQRHDDGRPAAGVRASRGRGADLLQQAHLRCGDRDPATEASTIAIANSPQRAGRRQPERVIQNWARRAVVNDAGMTPITSTTSRRGRSSSHDPLSAAKLGARAGRSAHDWGCYRAGPPQQ